MRVQRIDNTPEVLVSTTHFEAQYLREAAGPSYQYIEHEKLSLIDINHEAES